MGCRMGQGQGVGRGESLEAVQIGAQEVHSCPKCCIN